MSYTQYANEIIFQCPQELQDSILHILNEKYTKAVEAHKKAYASIDNEEVYIIYHNAYAKYMNEIKNIQDTLKLFKIYPVVNWAGHRDTFFFPTYEDCLFHEDWVLSSD